MNKKKKESRPFSSRMDAKVYDRMEEYCERTGVPKTVVIERALTAYIDECDADAKLIEQKKKIKSNRSE